MINNFLFLNDVTTMSNPVTYFDPLLSLFAQLTQLTNEKVNNINTKLLYLIHFCV